MTSRWAFIQRKWIEGVQRGGAVRGVVCAVDVVPTCDVRGGCDPVARRRLRCPKRAFYAAAAAPGTWSPGASYFFSGESSFDLAEAPPERAGVYVVDSELDAALVGDFTAAPWGALLYVDWPRDILTFRSAVIVSSRLMGSA
jgi:hypothetical protein